MFKNLKRISYFVQDIDKGREWYTKILNSEPLYSSPLIVLFKLNDTEVALLPSSENFISKGAVAYWETEDTDAAFHRLISEGAVVIRDPRTVVNVRLAEVSDPFGNIIGLTGKISEKKKTLEEQPSDSAYTVAFCRAISAAEPRKEIKGPDYLAHLFLHQEAKKPLQDEAAREWVMKNILQGGAYEYFIARTAYIDKIFKQSLDENIPQIVFLGAGYDTRAYRFHDCLKNTKVFELDSPPTQKRKLRLLDEDKIQWSANVMHIPVNFDTDDIKELLVLNGYETNKKTLFIWEGVTYYLSAESFYRTLSFIKKNSPAGSILCFDYMLFSEERHSRDNIKDALNKMKITYKAESVNFMVNEGDINKIMHENGFIILDEMTTKEMEDKYLKLKDGTLSGRIIDLFSFVLAEVR